jgi:hypothetical protein
MHKAKPLIFELSSCEAENISEKLGGYKSPGTDQILAEQIQAGGKTLRCEIHKLINSIWKREELPQQWKFLFIKRGTKLYVIIIEGYQCYQLHTKFYPIFLSLG